MVLTEAEKLEYTKYFEKYIYSLIKKFRYYIDLDTEDLVQEGYYCVLKVLNNLEEGRMSKVGIQRFINKSLVNYFLDLIQKYPSCKVVSTNIFTEIEGTDSERLGVWDDLSHVTVEEFIHESELKERDKQIIILTLCGYTQQYIADTLGVAQPAISYRLSKIRLKRNQLKAGDDDGRKRRKTK